MNKAKKAVAATCIALVTVLGAVAAGPGAEGTTVAGERVCC